MKKTKHTVALALAAMLACQPLSVYAATFADMNQVPWAGAEASRAGHILPFPTAWKTGFWLPLTGAAS